MTPRHFLNVESHLNWMAEWANGLLLLGIAEHKRDAAKSLCKGDYVVTYVRDRGFADVRCITGEHPVPLLGRVDYDEPLTQALETKPLASIHSDHHIPAAILTERLEFLANAHWKHAFQHSLRPISQEDGLLLVSLIVATAKAERVIAHVGQQRRLNPKRVIAAL